jgi:hypothetical protein
MPDKKVVRIEIEYEDGSGERAIGDDAEKIWQAINGGFVMNHIHGINYDGPQMKPVEKF